jgi:hypothetical protein
MKQTLILDFDGVLHSYTSPWKNARTIPDAPVLTAMAYLIRYVQVFEVVILSSRSHQFLGRYAMKRWLRKWMYRQIRDMQGGSLAIEEFVMSFFDSAAPQETNARDAANAIVAMIKFPRHKPPAVLTIDDRAIQFLGTFPECGTISGFIPWNKPRPNPGH